MMTGYYNSTAYDRMRRWIADSASAFVDTLIDLTPGGRAETDDKTRRILAEAEAEGARLIGAKPCPADHGVETDFGIVSWGAPCPSCGAAL